MNGVLCIDFGTSSIRAVRRMPNGALKPLDIGRVTNSRLDDASIRSEIHVDAQAKNVRFGELAFVARRASAEHLLYEPSPKLWLTRPAELNDPAAPGLRLTRANLLAGLLAYAIAASAKAADIAGATASRIELRVAHPVWPADVSDAANLALRSICAQARSMAFEREWATVTVSNLEAYAATSDPPVRDAVDVIEPVAAAVHLLPSIDNVRRACAVIDIGAGTSDIGLFQAVNPDEVSEVPNKLYLLAQPRSVFKAGNLIDEIVLELLTARAGRPSQLRVDDVRSRIRQVKEVLFQDGFVQELGANVQIEDLQSHPEAKAMAHDIRAALEAAVEEGSSWIAEMMRAPTWSIQQLDVVMAGGGGAIKFLRQAIKNPLNVAGRPLQVRIAEPTADPKVNLFGASPGRMAVAMGGASDEYDNLVHQMTRPLRYSRGRL